jgi:hypothetical protein
MEMRRAEREGVALLVDMLRREGFRVAQPLGDHAGEAGVDLLVYDAVPGKGLRALPLRVQAWDEAGFRFSREDDGCPGLVLAFVWHLASRPRCYLLGVEEARALAEYSTFYWQYGRFLNTSPGGQLRRTVEAGEDRWAWLRARLQRVPGSALAAAAEPLASELVGWGGGADGVLAEAMALERIPVLRG